MAVLAGATSYRGIVTFLAVHRDRLGRIYGVRLRRAPAVNTLRNLFLALDPQALEAAFRRHARHLGAARPDGPRAPWRSMARRCGAASTACTPAPRPMGSAPSPRTRP